MTLYDTTTSNNKTYVRFGKWNSLCKINKYNYLHYISYLPGFLLKASWFNTIASCTIWLLLYK